MFLTVASPGVHHIEGEISNLITVITFTIPLLVAVASLAIYAYFKLAQVYNQAMDNHNQVQKNLIPKVDAMKMQIDKYHAEVSETNGNGQHQPDTTITPAN